MRLPPLRAAAAAAALLWGLPLCGAPPQNLSGNWHLNVAKSKWGTMTRPQSVVLVIEHNEPSLHYHGEVVYANEEDRTFGFSGSFDGKPYPMSRSFGDGEIVLNRVDPSSFDSTFRTADGKSVEQARTSISLDGRTLTRILKLTSPDGVKKWTEVYDKR